MATTQDSVQETARAFLVGTPMQEKHMVFTKAFDIEDGRDLYDPEIEGAALPIRPMALTRSFAVGLAVLLVFLIQGISISKLIEETLWDGNKDRLFLIILCPLFIAFALFFMSIIVSSAFQLFGPVFDVAGNTKFHSAKAPIPARHRNLELPHITIQVPIYKEGLKGVIAPTIGSIQAAVRFYETRGGSASIFVCEDGMQVIKPELAEARQIFYEMNNVGWCARPPHGKDGYVRAGQFKKASNMNYAVNFSNLVEDEFLRLIRERIETTGCSEDDIVGVVENMLYKQAMDKTLKKDGGKTWAAGNLRMGEIILIVDSDTRVPIDALLMGALEMHESPEVAILQHTSGVMNVTGSAFENGIAYFTDLVYTSIKYAVGSGDYAPFVGHNAFLRWKAIQAISFEEDGMRKYWTDKHVSEDFQIALRLQIQGSIVRLASYHGGGFKEGVSLTVFDELARWQKYAFGCNEIIFHPIYKWYKGPFTPLFWQFLFSDMKPTTKISILGYMSTYYAIASAVPTTLANYFLMGWIPGKVDAFYINSWKVLVGIIFCFNIAAPFAFAAIRHRLGQKKFLPALIENAKWIPLFILFFGGLSIHMLKAICCHFFGIRMEWGSTAKELEATGFFIGLDKIAKDFKWMYLVMLSIVGGVVYLAVWAP
ncbi:hypothetical protein UCRPC4_g06949 [Phaeomoniella chlamydospora]|uniref:Glycosyltransferase 2-like domain-containing protein n=1 Tax=Phaeomoniella chlamydospora TaxID=158046 RepID=A0A0G2DSM1_PHACM|nr:hypothetical protein UCRPC4_g06949 [Phaeomoniella chlamydospora]